MKKRIICLLLALTMLAGLSATAVSDSTAQDSAPTGASTPDTTSTDATPPDSASSDPAPQPINCDFECEVEDFAFHSLTYYKADGVVTFVLSYESGIERTISLFDPPNGSVIAISLTLPATTGISEFTFQLDESELAQVKKITMIIYATPEEANNFSIVIIFAIDDTIADKSLADAIPAGTKVVGTAILSESGSYMLPVRAIFEGVGAEVEWDGNTKTVSISYSNEVMMYITVGSSLIKNSSGDSIDLAEPAINVNGRIYFCGDMFLDGNSGIYINTETLDVYVDDDVSSQSGTPVEPTPEAFVSNLTKTGSGLVRHPAARETNVTAPFTLSARSQYTRWIWTDTGEADIRWLDAKANLNEAQQSLLAKCAPNITFSSDTVFPDNMPEDYDPAAILEAGKDPGLGVRALHEKGVTGEGVGIAIIDQVLYTDHPEYKDKLALYEEIHIVPDEGSSMHGSAVASIAVGENIGVAPGAKLYYWAINFSRSINGGDSSDVNIAFSEGLVVAIDRIIEVNKTLPENEKIRVVSISRGFTDLQDEGVQAFIAAVKQAEAEGIFVISVSTNRCFDWLSDSVDISGLSKLDYTGDANDFNNYTLASPYHSSAAYYTSKLLIPMGARTTADCTVGDGYAFYSDGGISWTVPYLAGVYALACQVKPDITPEQFWALALETASSITAQIRSVQDVANGSDGTEYTFEHVINPTALIDALKKD